jgi:hypothetical protein
MKFELGKFYEHTTGSRLYIAGVMQSMFYGMTFVGEDEYGEFSPVGSTEDNAVNYKEITKEQFLDKATRKSLHHKTSIPKNK